MSLRQITVQNFRCFSGFQTRLAPGINLILGPNASGKTSFLEAIYYLGRGRSFRVAKSTRLINNQAKEFVLAGQIQTGPDQIQQLGVRFRPKDTLVKINGEKANGFAALAEALPVQVIHPESHRLVDGGPGYRRRFMDWGVFHVKPSFLHAWREFSKALKQRNAGLRQKWGQKQLQPWTELMARTGSLVDEYRREYVAGLKPFVVDRVQELLGLTVDLDYRSGWTKDQTLVEALEKQWDRDRHVHATTVGPQRGDLVLSVEGELASGRVSRGQQKLLAAALILGQVSLLEAHRPQNTVLLLDDPSAELDQTKLKALLGLAGATGTQVFISALRDSDIPDGITIDQVFHVEQGNLLNVI